jgi:hypothetical protein
MDDEIIQIEASQVAIDQQQIITTELRIIPGHRQRREEISSQCL